MYSICHSIFTKTHKIYAVSKKTAKYLLTSKYTYLFIAATSISIALFINATTPEEVIDWKNHKLDLDIVSLCSKKGINDNFRGCYCQKIFSKLGFTARKSYFNIRPCFDFLLEDAIK